MITCNSSDGIDCFKKYDLDDVYIMLSRNNVGFYYSLMTSKYNETSSNVEFYGISSARTCTEVAYNLGKNFGNVSISTPEKSFEYIGSDDDEFVNSYGDLSIKTVAETCQYFEKNKGNETYEEFFIGTNLMYEKN